ncbi:MAG: hypothetical protein CL840_16490 [Crocinitomicaceae bacterium]|nr:hypothetical protein [Crocinitomicaceae bacterium]|tara:strand:+ start:1749 stop:2123 length:375 start_codon:yes stop_codon:yes gene_type:complete
MASIKIAKELEAFAVRAIDLVNAYLKYYQIAAYENAIQILSKLLSRIIILLTFLISSLFASVWLSLFLGELFGKLSLGFLTVSGIYLLAGYLVHRFRNELFIDPFVGDLSELFEEKQIKEDEDV